MNELHQMLAAGNVQARPVLGEQFDFGTQTGENGPIGFFSDANEQSAFELGGTLDTLDRICVVAKDEIDADNAPEMNEEFTHGGCLLQVRAIREDQSAYVLGLKMLNAQPDRST